MDTSGQDLKASTTTKSGNKNCPECGSKGIELVSSGSYRLNMFEVSTRYRCENGHYFRYSRQTDFAEPFDSIFDADRAYLAWLRLDE